MGFILKFILRKKKWEHKFTKCLLTRIDPNFVEFFANWSSAKEQNKQITFFISKHFKASIKTSNTSKKWHATSAFTICIFRRSKTRKTALQLYFAHRHGHSVRSGQKADIKWNLSVSSTEICLLPRVISGTPHFTLGIRYHDFLF